MQRVAFRLTQVRINAHDVGKSGVGIETAQVMEELIAMAKKFKDEAERGVNAGLNADELTYYDALADDEESVRELGDETLKKSPHALAESLRKNMSVDWAVRDSVRAKLRLLVKRILRKYKYRPVKAEADVTLVLEQAETLRAEWARGRWRAPRRTLNWHYDAQAVRGGEPDALSGVGGGRWRSDSSASSKHCHW
jgi:hypothetical protein